jgi:hypothetical protein
MSLNLIASQNNIIEREQDIKIDKFKKLSKVT